MDDKFKKNLKDFARKCRIYLNAVHIQSRIGINRLELSSRTLSDLIEKYTIDYMIGYFGKDKVQFKNWRGYDVIVILLEEKVYVNIKTQESSDTLDATWLFSASVVGELKKKNILDRLYCIKFDYVKKDKEVLEITSAKVAGPISKGELIYYTRGDTPPCRLRAEYNGTHCHLRNEFYE